MFSEERALDALLPRRIPHRRVVLRRSLPAVSGPAAAVEVPRRPRLLGRARCARWVVAPVPAAAADHALESLLLHLWQVGPAAVEALILGHEVGPHLAQP